MPIGLFRKLSGLILGVFRIEVQDILLRRLDDDIGCPFRWMISPSSRMEPVGKSQGEFHANLW